MMTECKQEVFEFQVHGVSQRLRRESFRRAWANLCAMPAG